MDGDTGGDMMCSVEDAVKHPYLFAPKEKWDVLPTQIQTDPYYLQKWNHTIFKQAEELSILPPAKYFVDGTSGALDVARQVQLRIKLWAYAYRLSGDKKWRDRIWKEVVHAAGNSTEPFGEKGDNWYSQHWLDVGEFLVGFAVAYDWLYDAWSVKEREAIMWSIIDLGLRKGVEAFEREEWFLSVKGNWNCVTTGGMIVGALAILNEDPTGMSKRVLPRAVESARQYCAQSVDTSGTWVETPDYWYFGSQAHAQLSSALLVATGSTHGMLDSNPAFKGSGLFHIYNQGMTDKFNYGDCGPSKITATANALFFYSTEYHVPEYALYQRDRPDAADPLSMLWYPTSVKGTWGTNELALDKSFPDVTGAWVSMRSSWTDQNGIFVAMKGGRMTDHATHGNLDAGDFVLDALGERWALQLCQDSYDAPGYFSSEAQDSVRWSYYRCSTEGQNTILYNNSNQVGDAIPVVGFQSSFSTQSTTGKDDSGAFWVAELTEAYGGIGIKRGLRLSKGRRQVLVQDEIAEAVEGSQWRMHTKATMTLSKSGRIAHLRLNGKALDLVLVSPSTAFFHAAEAVRSKHRPPQNDLPNPGVGVLAIDLPPGNSTVAVLFCPRYEQGLDCSVSSLAPLDSWALN
ncbi:chondroitin AC/alginate lyase [Cladorrhinum sp. PSN332]|nr:chondroitin AC/alginate lyase [Cladorrhinum sp. PSN332]